MDSNLNNGSAKAWISFDGGSITTGTMNGVDSSFNISSITDNGVGNYTINFDTNMDNDNYAVSVSSDSSYDYYGVWANVHVKTASSVRVIFRKYSTTSFDPDLVSVIIFGEQS